MMGTITATQVADAAAGSVPVVEEMTTKKRETAGTFKDVALSPQTDFEPVPKKMKLEASSSLPEASDVAEVDGEDEDGGKKQPMTRAREIRLEQNRKAARESRRRKKVMIEELQRSVIFFSRANGTLKQQNDELSRILMRSQAQIQALENGQNTDAPASNVTSENVTTTEAASAPATVVVQYPQNPGQQAQAQAVATQAMYETQGYPPAAARAAAQTINPSTAEPVPAATSATAAAAAASPLPSLTPGSTMQAMANFQQAASAAMQAAMVNPAVAVQAATPAYAPAAMGNPVPVQQTHHFMGAVPFIAHPMVQGAVPGAWVPAPQRTSPPTAATPQPTTIPLQQSTVVPQQQPPPQAPVV